MPRLKFLPVVVLVLTLFAGFALGAATVTSNKFRIGDKPLTVTSLIHTGQTATETGVDSGLQSQKHAIVHKWSTISGQEIDVLVRVEEANGNLFVDLIADATISSLSTTVGSMNLTGIGHPSPVKDSVDKQALVSAGGS